MNPRVIAGLSTVVAGIIAAVLTNEGGYVNHPDDPGGETNYGITKRVAVQHGYTGLMKALPRETAFAIYDKEYITRPGLIHVIAANRHVGEEVVDSGVNFGPHKPGCWFQESLNHLNRRQADYPDVKVDCKIGPATMQAYAALEKRRGVALACELMIKLVDAKAANEYMRLASNNSRYEMFMPGWGKDRIGNVDFRRCRA